MEGIRFILIGQDKTALSIVKNTLTSDGHSFIGYTPNHSATLRLVRTMQPELAVIEPCGNLREVKQTIGIIDEEMLAAVIILLDQRKEDYIELINSSRACSYVTKPIRDDVLLQIADNTISSFRRTMEYENRLKQLNSTIETRKVVEKAKWILVNRDGLSEADAYAAIRKKSRENRITMKATAEAIILARG